MAEINNQDQQSAQRKKLHRQLDAIGWSLFFIWIGIAILTGLGWGAGPIGVGVIILVKLLAREFCKTMQDSGNQSRRFLCS